MRGQRPLIKKELLGMSKGKDLVKRDKEGLMPIQRQYLQALSETGSEKSARKKLGLKNDRVTRWAREDEGFKRAYDAYSQQVVESVQMQARVLSEKATEEIDHLLEEMKPIKVTLDCVRCGHKNSTYVQVRDAATRAKIAEMVWKATGVLKERKVVEGEVDVVHMNVGQKLALSLCRDGKRERVSAQAITDLINLGYIEEEEGMEERPPDPGIIDGEAREV